MENIDSSDLNLSKKCIEGSLKDETLFNDGVLSNDFDLSCKGINPDSILSIAADAGRLVLENGGETYRAEETMTLVSNSLGAVQSDAFVTPTVVILGCTDEKGEHHTCLHRVKTRGVNLSRLISLNNMSRRLSSRGDSKDTNPKQIQYVLSRIRNSGTHKNLSVVFAAALSSFFFAFVFKGEIFDAFAAFLVGGLLQVLLFLLQKYSINSFIKSILGGAFVSILIKILSFFNLVDDPAISSISVLMILVPGLILVNAIRDTIAGDLVAGVARFAEAFIIAAALSIGAGFGVMSIERIATFFQGFRGDYSLNLENWFFFENIKTVTQIIKSNELIFIVFSSGCAGLASGCFAFFFYASTKDITMATICGFLGWFIFSFAQYLGCSQIFAYSIASFSVGVFAEIGAVVFRQPATVGIVPGIIPLVPGGGMYETMLAVITGSLNNALQIGFSTLCIAGSIAVGLAIASSLARLASRIYFAHKQSRKNTKTTCTR